MFFQALGLSLLLLSGTCLANGRSPAVEDFVGTEIEESHSLPHGTESLYNLERDISYIDTAKNSSQVKARISQQITPEESPMNSSTFFGIAILLGLPVTTCLMIMHHLRRKAVMESASNIAILERYRQERERTKKQDEDTKKAS